MPNFKQIPLMGTLLLFSWLSLANEEQPIPSIKDLTWACNIHGQFIKWALEKPEEEESRSIEILKVMLALEPEGIISHKDRDLRRAIIDVYKVDFFNPSILLTEDNLSVDHVWPSSKGGPDHVSNYIGTTQDKNSKKTNRVDMGTIHILNYVKLVHYPKVMERYWQIRTEKGGSTDYLRSLGRTVTQIREKNERFFSFNIPKKVVYNLDILIRMIRERKDFEDHLETLDPNGSYVITLPKSVWETYYGHNYFYEMSDMQKYTNVSIYAAHPNKPQVHKVANINFVQSVYSQGDNIVVNVSNRFLKVLSGVDTREVKNALLCGQLLYQDF